jgi:2-deoxy-D-gluconate 3-dehydrogenase
MSSTLPVALLPRKTDALLDQARAEPRAAGGGLDQQQAQARVRLPVVDDEDAAEALPVSLRDPAALARRILLLEEVLHDPRHQRLELRAPAPFGEIHRRVAFHYPAHVAGPRFAQDDLAALRLAPEQRLDRAHGRHQARALRRRHRREHLAHLVARARVEQRVGLAPLLGEREEAVAAVVRRALRLQQAAALQALHQPAQVAQVHAERAAEDRGGGLRRLAELVEHPRLGQRIGAAHHAGLQHADAARVEAVEAPHRVDTCFCQVCHDRSMNPFDLKGKAALVTGGNGGIGLGMAKGLAAAGARVAIAGRDAKKNVAALKSLNENCISIQADLAKEAECRAMVEEAAAKLGRLDILINNAGMNIRKPPQDLPLEAWRQVMDVNLTSAFIAAQAAYPHLKRAGRGKIVNTGSMMSIFGAAYLAPYAASKGGIVQLTKALATAWAKDHIQVNAVLPGWIDTAMTQRARVELEGLNDRVLSRTPAGRWGEPADLAGIAVFLCSAASDFVTGTAIPVDGGYSVQG